MKVERKDNPAVGQEAQEKENDSEFIQNVNFILK